MEIALKTPDGDEPPRKLVRAAQYVRMSTEHQQYSPSRPRCARPQPK